SALKHLIPIHNLQHLFLASTPIDDSAVAHLKQIPSLRILRIQETKITAKGVAELQAALPKCAIFCDGGVVIPGATSPMARAVATTTSSTLQSPLRIPQPPPPVFPLEFNGQDSYVDLPTLRSEGPNPITLKATIMPYQTAEWGDPLVK